MTTHLVIWGAGGHAKVVFDAAQAAGYARIFFVDDNARAGDALYGCPVSALPAGLQLGGPNPEFIVAIGDNRIRARCYWLGMGQGWTPATLIHPSAVVSPHSEIAPGSVILPRAVVNGGAAIGRNCIVNTGAIVEHDCRISDHAHISPSATLGGNVHIGAFAHVGIGATVLPGCRIGEGSLVGAGAVVLSPVPEAVTVVGVPARILGPAGSPHSNARAGLE